MIPLTKALSSSVGKKLLMALTGVGLILFILLHVLGNLSLYKADGTTFNLYAAGMESFGVLLTIAEVGLATVFIVHIVLAVMLKLDHKAARPIGYKKLKTKGRPVGASTPSNISSRNMIITGVVLLAFLILHIWQFRIGKMATDAPRAEINGVSVVDLHHIVHTVFTDPLYVAIYVGAMLFLGFHMRHGFWSAFQSLGAMNARLTKPVYALGVAFAILVAAGFLFIPIWIYFDIPGMLS